MSHVVITHRVHAEVRARLRRVATLDVNDGIEPWSAAETTSRLADADAAMVFMTDHVDTAWLDAAPRLRVVAGALKGPDHIDIAACSARGVWVSTVPDLLAEPTAELAIGLAIGVARQVHVGDSLVRGGRRGGWQPRLYGRSLAGATVAVLGVGRVGRAIIERLRGFGCSRILGYDDAPLPAGVQRADLLHALSLADFAFVALPLDARTRGLIDADALWNARQGLVLVNVGRGSVVDEFAVARALDEGTLGAYAADVFAFEDLPGRGEPGAAHAKLLEHPHTLFTPHLGSAVGAVRLAAEHQAADNIIAVLQGGQPADAVNRPAKALCSA